MTKPLDISIIDFFESEAILGVKTLSPAQKVILKAIVGEVLDNKTPIPAYHEFIERDFESEVDLFLFLTEKDEYIPGYKYTDISLDAGRRGGKTLRKQTLIQTPYGPKAVEDMQIGDEVYGYNSKGEVEICKVKDVIYNGIKDLYPVVSANKDLVWASKDHRFLCSTYRTKNKSPKERALKDFAKKDQYIERRFVEIPCGKVTEPHAYAIGALLGDGCSRQYDKNGTKIWISSIDSTIPEKVCEILGAEFVKRNHETNYNWEITSTDYVHCNNYDNWCKGKYAHEKVVDWNIINSWDRKSCLQFMAGLLDTDGSVSVTKDNRLEISLGMQAKPVVEAFRDLFFKLYGRQVNLKEDKRTKYKNGNIHIFMLANNQYTKRFLYEVDKYLVSPQRKWKPEYGDLVERNYKADRIGVKVDWDRVVFDHSYDIEIDNDTNLYILANEGLITHNSNMVGAGLCVYWATQKDFSSYLGTSPFATMPIISPTKEQAGEVYAAVKNFFLKSPYLFQTFLNGEVNRLEPEYDEESTDKRRFTGGQIKLNNKVVIKTLTADVSRIRGFAVPFYILDEACWFGSENSDSKNTDVGINEAIQPATAQFGELAFGLKISSPNGESGLMYNDYLNRKDIDVLHIKAPTWYMNPNITVAYLEKQRKKGEHYFRREYGADYVASENAFLDPKLIDNCVLRGVDKIDYQPGYVYAAAIDYATKNDYWTFAIGHKEYRIIELTEDTITKKEKVEQIYIDFLMHWKGSQGSELDPREVVSEISKYLKEYRVPYVLTDQYAHAAIKNLFQLDGQAAKEFATSAQSKKKYMYSLQVAINSSALKMVNKPLAAKHLKNLREKRTANGQIKIEHAANTNDDYADSIALVVFQFDKTSPVYIGHIKDEDYTPPPTTKDATGKYISTPTAEELAGHTGVRNFVDNSNEYDDKGNKIVTENEEDSSFWFSF